MQPTAVIYVIYNNRIPCKSDFINISLFNLTLLVNISFRIVLKKDCIIFNNHLR